jgi:hypothetical protein
LQPGDALSQLAVLTTGALFLLRKRTGYREKLLLPLQIELAKGVDEIIHAIFYGRNAITASQPRPSLLGVCRLDCKVRRKPERGNSEILCDPGQHQLGSQLRTCFIEKVLIGPDPKLAGKGPARSVGVRPIYPKANFGEPAGSGRHWHSLLDDLPGIIGGSLRDGGHVMAVQSYILHTLTCRGIPI